MMDNSVPGSTYQTWSEVSNAFQYHNTNSYQYESHLMCPSTALWLGIMTIYISLIYRGFFGALAMWLQLFFKSECVISHRSLSYARNANLVDPLYKNETAQCTLKGEICCVTKLMKLMWCFFPCSPVCIHLSNPAATIRICRHVGMDIAYNNIELPWYCS